MTVAVFPGSFDPITLGHVDIAQRALSFVDRVVIAVGMNPSKKYLFDPQTRLELARQSVAEIDGVEAQPMDGLLVDFCARVDASIIIKGIRGMGDYAAEEPMARMNRHLSGIETVFILSSPDQAHIASSLVKDVALNGGKVEDLVPPAVARAIAALTQEKR